MKIKGDSSLRSRKIVDNGNCLHDVLSFISRYLLLSPLIFLSLLTSCSTEKAKWTNIQYHNITTHYNVWWNGNESLKAGHPQGNTNVGKTDGSPNAHLQGRTVLGTLPRPSYAVQNSGIVVVKIWVDQYGTVQKAVAGHDGTTVTDKDLWNAARKAALGAHFNMSADAPALQEGTITYKFNLK